MSDEGPTRGALSEADVRRVATLARLALSDEQVRVCQRDMGAILTYVERLSTLDLDGVDPLFSPLEMAGRLAPDEPGPRLSVEQVMALAPQSTPPFVKVPKVLGGGEGA